MYYTTGFCSCEIKELCALVAEIQSSIPLEDRREWPPILGLDSTSGCRLDVSAAEPRSASWPKPMECHSRRSAGPSRRSLPCSREHWHGSCPGGGAGARTAI